MLESSHSWHPAERRQHVVITLPKDHRVTRLGGTIRYSQRGYRRQDKLTAETALASPNMNSPIGAGSAAAQEVDKTVSYSKAALLPASTSQKSNDQLFRLTQQVGRW